MRLYEVLKKLDSVYEFYFPWEHTDSDRNCPLFGGEVFQSKVFERRQVSLDRDYLRRRVVQVLKHLVGRVRPKLTDNLVLVGPSLKTGYDSFPSGHATVAFCMAYILASYFPRYRVCFYFWAAMIGLERVEGIAHFPSDVLAGAVIGIVIAKLLSVKVFRSESSALCNNLSGSGRNFVQENRS